MTPGEKTSDTLKLVLVTAAVLLGFLIAGTVIFFRMSGHREPPGEADTLIRMGRVLEIVEERYAVHGIAPTTLDAALSTLPDDEAKLIIIDGWGRPFRYRLSGRIFSIQSGGPDRQLGTSDDYHLVDTLGTQFQPK